MVAYLHVSVTATKIRRLCEYEISHCGSTPCVSGRYFNHFESYTCVCDAFHADINCENFLRFLVSTEMNQITSEVIQSTANSIIHPSVVASTEPLISVANLSAHASLSPNGFMQDVLQDEFWNWRSNLSL